jgi:large subunit ribosomal protein L6
LLIFIKMEKKKKSIVEELEIPSGVTAEIKDNVLIVKKEDNEIKKKMPGVTISLKDNKITIKPKKQARKEKKKTKSVRAHILNMFKGLNEKYTYKLQICAVHFPMTVKTEKDKIIIKNFLGEQKERRADIIPNVEVKVSGEIITVTSCDKEAAGQTAANIEKAAKSRNKDKRIFQDGIFMTEQAGRAL